MSTTSTVRETTRRHAFVPTSLGDLLVVAEDDAVVGDFFPGHWYPPAAADTGERVEEDDDELISATAAQVREYLAGQRVTFDVPLRTSGDAFSEQVWARLRQIPYGTTTTYGAIATELGNRALAQRVGQAVGHNPLSIVVPCHRVVGSDGSLTGFAGGLERKRALLALEEPADVQASRLF
ncbi:methylated-DNA--[protein]-cysteine S-methyltransferase [Tersicoccus sp. Bi-70]|uniref:methylated-DNA--[protein]-cysteine S-methyltransferase n=1 Tax=Tersicoccus sp. Bi-70 TaxID=1897634 RepID=UPI001E4F8E09|nr:methylated-DNA--[protein]-cysteine S-methyltransferase [Tersicoccus sp. Bi-70]